MTKQNLFVDMDNTIIDTTTAFCKTYNYMYKYEPNFKMANPEESKRWDFKDVCTLIDSSEEIFNSEHFFRVVMSFPNATKILGQLKQKYKIIIVSIGGWKNIAYKSLYIKFELPFIDDAILIHNQDCAMNKSLVNMEDGIFIDDVKGNLDSSNAKLKICYGKKYDWNKDWKGVRCGNWQEVSNLLLNRAL